MRFGNKNEGEPEDFPAKARRLVMEQYNETGIATPRGQRVNRLTMDDVYVVWFAYTLGNWKALVSTTRPDDRYYEVTHKRENDGSDGPSVTYIDTYLKTHNTVVED